MNGKEVKTKNRVWTISDREESRCTCPECFHWGNFWFVLDLVQVRNFDPPNCHLEGKKKVTTQIFK